MPWSRGYASAESKQGRPNCTKPTTRGQSPTDCAARALPAFPKPNQTTAGNTQHQRTDTGCGRAGWVRMVGIDLAACLGNCGTVAAGHEATQAVNHTCTGHHTSATCSCRPFKPLLGWMLELQQQTSTAESAHTRRSPPTHSKKAPAAWRKTRSRLLLTDAPCAKTRRVGYTAAQPSGGCKALAAGCPLGGT